MILCALQCHLLERLPSLTLSPKRDFVTAVGEAEIIKTEQVLSITIPPPVHTHACVCIHHLLSNIRHKLMITIVKHSHLNLELVQLEMRLNGLSHSKGNKYCINSELPQ